MNALYTEIVLNSNTNIRLKNFISVSDFLELRDASKLSGDEFEYVLHNVLIFEEDTERYTIPLEHEILSNVGFILYKNELISERAYQLEDIQGSIKNYKFVMPKVYIPKVVLPPMPKVYVPRVELPSMGSEVINLAKVMEKTVATWSNAFRGIAQQVGDQLKNIAEQIREVDVTYTDADQNFFKFMIYEKFFKEKHIHVDNAFLDYLINRYGSFYRTMGSDELINSAEKVFMEYWLYCIDNQPKELCIPKEDSKDGNTMSFLHELKTVMGQANYLSSVLMLHIYIEKITKELLDELALDDFIKKTKINLPPRLKKRGGKPAKFRYVLMRSVHPRLVEIEHKSLEVFDEYAPLYLYCHAFVDYENPSVFQQRNDLIHFNTGAKYEEINILEMLKLFQLLKVLIENKHVFKLLKEWSDESWDGI
ncbi:hypothetical protein M3557_14560 [Bhargavaea ginsengi]|uniref:hypothetical protein n=1 Tax=Bhargavaea ginsengi TaxID=426757 RepID=UPI00203EFA87|nr:hypothetical protein [Bhargavaea ginsengi]MCM3089138.1 hypothetical protein [Bhargavaea ginsengi]